MKTLLEVLNLSTDFLEQKNIANPKRQAEELLGEALKLGRLGLYLEYDRPLTEPELVRCREWLQRRGMGEPIQYISGEVDFFGCRLKITPDVLIPRQETEILVDKITKILSTAGTEGKTLWDVCCGPGSMGIALKKRFPDLKVCLSDLSPTALAIAKENAEKNDVDVEFFQGDLLAPFGERKSDFIVCNPPYIAENEYAGLDIEVRKYEPKMALVSGDTGLEFYVRLAKDLPKYLNSKGKVWFEIGDGQAQAIEKMFCAACWTSFKHELDWSGRERFFSLEIE